MRSRPWKGKRADKPRDPTTATDHLTRGHNLASFMTGELRYAVLKSPPTAKEMIKPCLATAEDLQMSLAELNAAAQSFSLDESEELGE